MKLSQIKHKFQKEIFVPWCAISNNIRMSDTVEMSDGVVCMVKKKQEVHIMSKEADEIIERLYKLSVWQFMVIWFKQASQMASMWFVWMELEPQKKEEEVKDEE